MNLYLKTYFGPGNSLKEAFQNELKEQKLKMHYIEESHTLKLKASPADRLLQVIKKWPAEDKKKDETIRLR